MVLLDQDGMVAFANRHALALVEGPGAPLPTCGNPVLQAAVNALVEGGVAFEGVESVWPMARGATAHIVASGTVVRDGAAAAAVVTLVDVTPVRSSEAVLALGARVDAAEASLRNDAVAGLDALALLESALHTCADALAATVATAFVAVGTDSEPFVRCAAWPAAPLLDELDPSAWPALARGQVASAPPDALLPGLHALLLPVRGAATGALMLARKEPWDAAERAAGARLAALFSTLWAWADAEARFQRTVADLDDCLFTLGHTLEGRRVYSFVTPQVEALTGLDPDALLAGDADWAAWVHPDDRQAFAAHDARLRAGHSSRVDVRLVLDSGDTVWVCERAAPSVDAAGRLTASGLLQDVTAQKEAEATLDQARRVAERAAATRMAFLRLMSHELRTPLGAIRGFADVLADEVAALAGAPPEAIEFAGTIREAADRALHLVSNLLDLSRLETGALDLAAVPVDLATVARAVATRYAGALAPGVALQVDLPDEAVVRADPGRTESVVDALVANAAAFTPTGSVTLRITRDASAVCLEVQDTGTGMAPDFAERLFEPFAQEDTRVARGHEGTGLSLAIAYRLVRQMGGTLCVQTALGAGTTFTVCLAAETRRPGEPPPPHCA